MGVLNHSQVRVGGHPRASPLPVDNMGMSARALLWNSVPSVNLSLISHWTDLFRRPSYHTHAHNDYPGWRLHHPNLLPGVPCVYVPILYLTGFKPKAMISLAFVSILRGASHSERVLYTQLSYICLDISQHRSCPLLSIDFTPHVSSHASTP